MLFNWDHEIINDGQSEVWGACVWNIEIQFLSLWEEQQLCTGIVWDNSCQMKEQGSIFLHPTGLSRALLPAELVPVLVI